MELNMKRFIIFCTVIMTIVFSSASCVYAVQKTWANPKHLNTYVQPGFGRSTMMKHAFAEWSQLTKNKVIFYYAFMCVQEHTDTPGCQNCWIPGTWSYMWL